MLEVKNLSAGYGGDTVLHHINLTFLPGTLYTIVGKNGCGKSTLLKACAGLLPAAEGEILLEGRDLSTYQPNQRAQRISYLAQCGSIPAISAERFVMHGRHPHLGYPRKPRSVDRAAIDQAMELMKVDVFRNKSLGELSGGERQRVYLAMQLAQDTPIMLLDEPTTYMDLGHQLELLELLGSLKEQGKCIVMVLHDLEQALDCSDQIIAVDEGRVVRTGSPRALLDSGILAGLFGVEITRLDAGERGCGYLFRTRKGPTT